MVFGSMCTMLPCGTCIAILRLYNIFNFVYCFCSFLFFLIKLKKSGSRSSLTSNSERSQCVGNLPRYDRREVCTSHHHEQWRYIDTWIQWSPPATQQWLKQPVGSLANIGRRNNSGSLQKFLIYETKRENWERKDLSLKDLRNTRSGDAWKRLKKTG